MIKKSKVVIKAEAKKTVQKESGLDRMFRVGAAYQNEKYAVGKTR